MKGLYEDLINILRRKIRARKKKKVAFVDMDFVGKMQKIKNTLPYFSIGMYMLLFVSGVKIAQGFQHGHFALSAWVQAIAIEFSVGMINLAISNSRVVNLKTKFMWFIVVILMLISVHANIRFGYIEVLAQHGVNIVNATTIKMLDWWEQTEVIVYSLPIPFLVLGLSFAQQNQNVAIDIHTKHELKRMEINEYQRARRKRLKKGKRTRKAKRG